MSAREVIQIIGRKDLWTEYVDADQLKGQLVVRNRRPGDRFHPLGMQREMRLKKFMQNLKLTPQQRQTCPLLCDKLGIVWVVPYRVSHRVRITPQSSRILVLKFMPHIADDKYVR
jgi:tRNA(Ile)-lysidine synthase